MKVIKRPIVEIVTTDLRALLHWACVGVSQSRGGSYQNDIENIIDQYARDIGFYKQLPTSPVKFKKEIK